MEGRGLVLFLGVNVSFVINKVIEGFGIIGELEVVEVGAEAYEAVDDRKVKLGEVNADRVPVELIVLVVKEPLGGEIKGVLGDWMTIVITGVGRGEFIKITTHQHAQTKLKPSVKVEHLAHVTAASFSCSRHATHQHDHASRLAGCGTS